MHSEGSQEEDEECKEEIPSEKPDEIESTNNPHHIDNLEASNQVALKSFAITEEELSKSFAVALEYYNNKKYGDALKQLQLLATGAHALPEAMGYIGDIYRKQQGVKRDWKKAYEWYRLGAEKKNARCLYGLGWLIQNGKGVGKNETEAARLFRISATLGFGSACTALGRILRDGQGIKRNRLAGLYWLQRAVTCGDEKEAKSRVEKLEKELGFPHPIELQCMGTPFDHESAFPLRSDIPIRFHPTTLSFSAAMLKAASTAHESIFLCGWSFEQENNTNSNSQMIFLQDSTVDASTPSNELKLVLDAATRCSVPVFVILNGTCPKEMTEKVKNLAAQNYHIQFHACKSGEWVHHQALLVIDHRIAFISSTSFAQLDACGLEVATPCCGVELCDTAALDVSINFVQRWNAAKNSQKSFFNRDVSGIVSLSYPDESVIRQPVVMEPQEEIVCRAKCQILRSISNWALHCDSDNYIREDSIAKCYIDAIQNAEKYVFIECDYFCSLPEHKNEICKAIMERIGKAIDRGTIFHVIVVIPSPCVAQLEDSLKTKQYLSLLQSQNESIRYIESEINKKILSMPIAATDPEPLRSRDFISFYTLRDLDLEIGENANLYLISKPILTGRKLLMTEQCIIAGTSNISDRCLRGSKDSEIAVAVFDKGSCEELFKYFTASYLGVPSADEFYLWEEIASQNTQNLCSIFGPSIPETVNNITSGLHSFLQFHNQFKKRALEGYSQNFSLDDLRKELRMQGILAEYNAMFLAKELSHH